MNLSDDCRGPKVFVKLFFGAVGVGAAVSVGSGANDLLFTMSSFARDGLLHPSARGGKLLSGGVEVGDGEVGGGVWELNEQGDPSAKTGVFGVDVCRLAENQAIAKAAGSSDKGVDF